MSCEEHYFENLLFHGEDKCNKDFISKEKREAIETCVNYVIYTLFVDREDFLSHFKE